MTQQYKSFIISRLRLENFLPFEGSSRRVERSIYFGFCERTRDIQFSFDFFCWWFSEILLVQTIIFLLHFWLDTRLFLRSRTRITLILKVEGFSFIFYVLFSHYWFPLILLHQFQFYVENVLVFLCLFSWFTCRLNFLLLFLEMQHWDLREQFWSWKLVNLHQWLTFLKFSSRCYAFDIVFIAWFSWS